MKIGILILFLYGSVCHGQFDFGLVKGEIGPTIISFDTPSQNMSQVPCKATFINYTEMPLQINWLHPSGRMQKLMYVAPRDTVTVKTKTHHHLFVCLQGVYATAMFIPVFDENICKVHDKMFNYAKKIPNKLYKPIPSDLKAAGFKYKVPKGLTKTGSKILFDQAHLNNYKLSGLFKPFGKLLKMAGYAVEPIYRNLTLDKLKTGKILVIANAYGQNVNGWLVDSATALTTKETNVLKQWVKSGGSLLLIMDHIPYPSRAENIAKAFGFNFYDCHVLGPEKAGQPDVFSKSSNTLSDHIIFSGKLDSEKVTEVATFWGAGMEIPKSATPLITFSKEYQAVFAHAPWKLEEADYRKNAKGLHQAAVMPYGEGKVAVFCDIDMFTSMKSRSSGSLVGMNHEKAKQNPQFILNTIHWLDGLLD